MTFPDPNRRDEAKVRRNRATDQSTEIAHPPQMQNGEENSPYIFSFTKGLRHDRNGLLDDPVHFEQFRDGTESSDPMVFQGVQLNMDKTIIDGVPPAMPADYPAFRQWESPTAGLAYVLEGPDPLALKMPPAPPAGSAELAAEIAEVYQMALFRDLPVAAFMDEALIDDLRAPNGNKASAAARNRLKTDNAQAVAGASRLSAMRWFSGVSDMRDLASSEERARRRFGKPQNTSNMFRGEGEDPWPTPFVSQFMIMGVDKGSRDLKDRSSGLIKYGNQRIDQEVAVATPGKDYMTTWSKWLDVQNAWNARGVLSDFEGDTEFKRDADGLKEYRPISRLRDLATYVHDDALYQAYLNAALILLGEGYPFDPGIPYHNNSDMAAPNREPFALFGPPHLLTLVTEVSSRALKAVRAQKFSVHRRLRPEALGGLFHTIYSGFDPDRENPAGSTPLASGGGSKEAAARMQLGNTLADYTFPPGSGTDPKLEDILVEVRKHNARQNSEDENNLGIAKWLLPMAFPEGSPMHPAYGAGHATVAGACVTLLKAFFNMRDAKNPALPAYLVSPGERALVPDGGTSMNDVTIDLFSVDIPNGLTLEGELNKLMWNISNARNIAGVHYYTDYVESAVLGEDITLGILREQMVSYDLRENVTMTVPLIAERTIPAVLRNGGSILPHQRVASVIIDRDGHLHADVATPRPH